MVKFIGFNLTIVHALNHLAHVHLSGLNHDIIVGNLAADYLNKQECLELPLSMQDGVGLHRHIDHSTDNYPAVREAWAVLRVKHGKYASVIYDIYCDYLLTKHWDDISEVPLKLITKNAYQALSAKASVLPDKLAVRFERMAASDWLSNYGSYERQALVFRRFGRRLSKPELLTGVIETLGKNEARLTASFLEFYPWMVASANTWLEENHITPQSED